LVSAEPSPAARFIPLCIRGIPGREGNAERRRVGNAFVRRRRDRATLRLFERRDDEIVAGALDDRGRHIDDGREASGRIACAVSQRTCSVETGRDDRERRTEAERLRDGIAVHPSAVGERLEDRVCGGLGELEFARDVGEPHLRVFGPAEQLDDVENAFGRCRAHSAQP
jgi:hypothetical protein